MTNSNNFDCTGCKVSMFCSRNGKELSQPCGTSLKAVLIAFVIPTISVALILAVAEGRIDEILTALGTLLFLVIYFFTVRAMKIDFSKKS